MNYLTCREIARLWRTPESTVRWLAHRERWRRTGDKRRPVLYLLADVEDTMAKRLDRLTSANDPDPMVEHSASATIDRPA